METKEIIKVLEVLRFGLADSYRLPTPMDFAILSDVEKLEVYDMLFQFVHKNLSAMSNIIELSELIKGRD